MVEMAIFNIYNVERAVTPKVGLPELWFLCSACRLIVLYICKRIHENISNHFQLTGWTWVHGGNGYVWCSKGNNSKSRHIRVTVHVFCTLSYGALYLCEVLWKYHERYQSYRIFQYLWYSKGHNSKNRLTRVMVLMFCLSSHGTLYLWEISWKYLKQFSTYRVDRTTWWTWLGSMFKGQ